VAIADDDRSAATIEPAATRTTAPTDKMARAVIRRFICGRF